VNLQHKHVNAQAVDRNMWN